MSNGSALPPPDTFGLDSPTPDERDDFGKFEQQKQVEMMQEQDEALDDVFKTVGNLRQQGLEMGRELEEQREELEDVDNLADRVGGKLQHGLKRVGWVIKKNEGECCLRDLKIALEEQKLIGDQKRGQAAVSACSF